MDLTFIHTPAFVAKAAKLGLKDEDLQEIERLIMEHPDRGDMMQGTGGLRKMRFSPRSSSRGNSGSARVCYIVFVAADTCYLVTIFAKNEKPNLSDPEKAQLRKWSSAPKIFWNPRQHMSKKKSQNNAPTNDAGHDLLEGVRQMHEAVSTGNLRGFKVSRVSVPDPGEYPPQEIKRLRESTGITQPMLAAILGVSTEAVEHWEQGLRRPAATARRLMDQIRQRPDDFLAWLLRNPSTKPQPGRPQPRELSKTRARALLRMAAKVLTQQEMVQAVRGAYAGRAGSDQ